MFTSNIVAISDMYNTRSATYDLSNNSLHVHQSRHNYLRQTVQARLLASFSRTSSQSRRDRGHSHS